MLFEFLKDLSNDKKDLSERDDFEKEYSPYIVNLFLTASPDVLYAVDEVNYNWRVPKKFQYKCLLNLIRKKHRKFFWKKKQVSELDSILSEYYRISKREAQLMRGIHTDEEIQIIQESLNKGGFTKDG